MNDPEVVKFLNEHTRRAADKLASAYLEAVAHLAGFAAISGKVPNDSTAIDDGRSGEGVSAVNCAKMRAIVGIMNTGMASLSHGDGIAVRVEAFDDFVARRSGTHRFGC